VSIKNIRELFHKSIELKQKLLESEQLVELNEMGRIAALSIKSGNKLMFCGNGGSAADAQHLVAEMLVRLRPDYNRKGIPAITLAQDTSTITACGNDYSYDSIYERVVQSLGKEGDILVGITTSGNSVNILKAMQMANKMKIQVFGFLGHDGGKALDLCDSVFLVPDKDTGRIQEVHITAGHALMESIEDRLIESGYLSLEN